ncbi:MAG TPA: GAF and ANTAR domain-containing protein [Mycobacteriales bacterium]|jgi:GAF domain-containing protein|nr:GAF and ANTAR domain-containing protein [Mycobacteriales bacterium]
MDDDAELSAGVRELLGLLVEHETVEQTLHRVAALACRAIDGCDAATVALARDTGPVLVAATEPALCGLEEAQYATGTGPGADTVAGGTAVAARSAGEAARWPEFAAGLRSLGYAAFLALPLRTAGGTLGTLALYRRRRGGFGDGEPAAAELASLAAVAIANARVYAASRDLANRLRAAHPDDAVDQATGIVLAEHATTPAEALEWLRQRSRERDQPLAEVAAAVVEARTSRTT